MKVILLHTLLKPACPVISPKMSMQESTPFVVPIPSSKGLISLGGHTDELNGGAHQAEGLCPWNVSG